jgi:hypothetical protein
LLFGSPLTISTRSANDKRSIDDVFKMLKDASTQTEKADSVLDEPVISGPPKKVTDQSWMLSNANEDRVILCLTPNDIQQSTNPVTIKAGYEVLASYSWKQTDASTIYVPGTPALFSAREFADPQGGPVQLEPDSGSHWFDQHMQRAPTHQFEPMFQALSVLDPARRFNNIDIVVNRNSLSVLLQVLGNKYSQRFHLTLDLIGKTLFLGRQLKNAKVHSQPGSYGRSFESYFTTEDPDLEHAEGHHRMLRYAFGGLNMVVRIETDAYLPDEATDSVVPHPSCTSPPGPAPGIPHSGPDRTQIIVAGTLAPHPSTLELKSRHVPKPLEQMWFGRTPTCFLGRHKDGLVKRADVVRYGETEFEDWETRNQAQLQRLEWLLRELRRVVQGTREGAAVLVSLGKGEPLRVYETRERVGAVPREVVERFWDL